MAQQQVNIAVLSSKDASELKELDALPSGANIVAIGTADQLLEEGDRLSTADVLLSTGFGVGQSPKEDLKKIWPKLPKLKWVHATSAGVTHLLWEGLVESDVVLTNAKGTFSHSLAEYALTACLYFAKQIPVLQEQQRNGKWNKIYVEELRGKQLGVIGFGDIGQTTAKLGKAFGMKIAALRRRTELSQEEQKQGLKVYSPEELTDLTASSDYIVTALPSTPGTENFVSAKAIAAMQPHAVFINLGRGATVDEDALTEALREKQIRGAALDVFATEPLPESSPLWNLENVLISPHCADMTRTFLAEAVQQFVQQVEDYVAGKPLQNVCDKAEGY